MASADIAGLGDEVSSSSSLLSACYFYAMGELELEDLEGKQTVLLFQHMTQEYTLIDLDGICPTS